MKVSWNINDDILDYSGYRRFIWVISQVEDSSGPVGRGKSKMKEIGSNLYKHGRFQSGKLYVKEKTWEKARPAVLSEEFVLPRRLEWTCKGSARSP